MLTLYFTNVIKKVTTASKRQWVIEKTVELNLPIYIKKMVTTEWISSNILHWEQWFVYIFFRKWKTLHAMKTHKDLNWVGEISWKPSSVNQKSAYFSESISVYNFFVNIAELIA